MNSPDVAEFHDLCNRVERVSAPAAEWLRKCLTDHEVSNFVPCGFLNQCFVWSESPQGELYWEMISDEMKRDADRDQELEDGYRRLCDRVDQIDPGAAEYLRDKARTLPNFNVCESLWGAFTWANSEQGIEYWVKIALELDRDHHEARLHA